MSFFLNKQSKTPRLLIYYHNGIDKLASANFIVLKTQLKQLVIAEIVCS